MKRRAGLFLDRDGTIIEDVGYLSDPEGVRLYARVGEALRRAARFYQLYLFTNQSGIGRGYYGIDAAEACNRRLEELLALPGGGFSGICVAPEAPDDPPVYRKPSPRFIIEMIARDGLDAGSCWMVGDRLSDLESGISAGVRVALVRQSPHSTTAEVLAYVRRHAIPVYDTLVECIDALLEEACCHLRHGEL